MAEQSAPRSANRHRSGEPVPARRRDAGRADATAERGAGRAGADDAATIARYRGLCRLAADWYWELDAELRYVFHDGHPMPHSTLSTSDYLGLARPGQLERDVGTTDAVLEHNRLMRLRLPIDLVLSMEVAPGASRHLRVVAEPLFDADGAFAGYRGCGRDVTERVRLKERFVRLAMHDDLTGMINRREFRARLESAHAIVRDDPATERSLCVVDLDRFKLVNDTAGHSAGDALLRDIAAIMRRFVAPEETLARLGGDEFAVLLDTGARGAHRRMELLIDAIAAHEFVWEERRYAVGASVGVTSLDAGSGDVGTFVDRADAACYAAKADGRNRCVVFTPDSEAYRRHRAEIEQVEVIKEALRANRLRLYMQGIEPADGERARPHHEILLRLESEDGELMAPSTFIPVAERFMIMQELDQWVLERCLDTLEAFAERGEEISLSINLSGNTLSDRGCLEHIVETVESAATDPSLLCFEITESAAITNIDAVVEFMHEMKAIGVRFALDDFGAGLSSFAYIRSLPIDFLKIDGYFIRNIRSDATNRAITAAFIQLSAELGIATVAEFVEDKATRRTVTEMGIDYVQGYGVSRPTDVNAAIAALPGRALRRVVGA